MWVVSGVVSICTTTNQSLTFHWILIFSFIPATVFNTCYLYCVSPDAESSAVHPLHLGLLCIPWSVEITILLHSNFLGYSKLIAATVFFQRRSVHFLNDIEDDTIYDFLAQPKLVSCRYTLSVVPQLLWIIDRFSPPSVFLKNVVCSLSTNPHFDKNRWMILKQHTKIWSGTFCFNRSACTASSCF